MKVHLPNHNGYPACGSKVPGKKVPEPEALEDVTCGACKRSIRYESKARIAGFEKIEAARAKAAENTEDHDIEVYGAWRNDGTADLVIWCGTCQRALVESEESLTPAQINTAVKEH